MKKHNYILLIILTIIGCSKNDDIEIVEPLLLQLNVENPSGYMINDGSIQLTVEGGTEPYRIKWVKDNSNSYGSLGNSESLINIDGGMYFVTVTDTNELQAKDSIFLASNETIKPKEYFPAYPGSYWTYSNGETVRTSEEYIKTEVYNYIRVTDPWMHLDGKYYPSDYLYLPTYNGQPILEYYVIDSREGVLPKQPIIHANRFDYTILNPYSRYGNIVLRTETIDTTLVVNGTTYSNVIITLQGFCEEYDLSDFPSESRNIEKKYYAKDIGLIRVDLREEWDTTFRIVKEITEWHINK